MDTSFSPKLLYISHLPRTPSGGGVYAVSWNVAKQLDSYFQLRDPGHVETPSNAGDAFISKVKRRIFRRPSKFHAFSNSVLKAIASKVEALQEEQHDAIFFRSSTRWSECRPKLPYFVHTDVVFHTFFENTFSPQDFLASDLERIHSLERQFLANAKLVFFESNWGLNKAKEALKLDGKNFVVARNGGGLLPPPADLWDGKSRKLLTIAKDFYQKGGDLVLEAFRILKPRYPNLEWHIIGGKPSEGITSTEGIHYEGFLRPSVAEELERFQTILQQCFLLVHPTREDTNPLVLVEAGYFGSPSVSIKDFAIPELILDKKTGLLLERPVSGNDVARKIAEILDSPNYMLMRTEAREYATSNFSWEKTGRFMASQIKKTLVSN